MEKALTELSKMKCMQYFGLMQMPEPAKEGQLWSSAILRVLKNDGYEYYVAQGTDNSGNLCIKADYEGEHCIIKTIETHPIMPFEPKLDKIPLEMCSKKDLANWITIMDTPLNPGQWELNSMKTKDIYDLCVRCLRLMNREEIKQQHK